MNYLLVFIGGGIGSMFRFGIGKFFSRWNFNFPLATLISNISACIIFTLILYFWTKELKDDWIIRLLSLVFVVGLALLALFHLKTFNCIIKQIMAY